MAEYTISFKEAGFSAEEMFAILSNGAQKGYNLDRLNDTMLEFKLQSEDSSDAYLEAMSQMSKSTRKVWKDYQNGKATVSDVYKAILPDLERLKKTIPEKDFNVIGKSLFGKLMKLCRIKIAELSGKAKGLIPMLIRTEG